MKKRDIPVVYLCAVFLFTMLVTFCMLFAEQCHASEIERHTEASMIRGIALEEGFDPELAVAIATVESGLNERAIGTQGEIGLFQLKPQYHHVLPGHEQSNVRVAIRYLKKLKETFEPVYGDAWMLTYNVGPNYSKAIRYPRLFPYVKKINQARERLASL